MPVLNRQCGVFTQGQGPYLAAARYRNCTYPKPAGSGSTAAGSVQD